MRNISNSTRLRIKRALCLLLMALVLPGTALSEVDEDFLRAVEDYNRAQQEIAPAPNEEPQAVNMSSGDITLGYVASEQAYINPLLCTERDLVSLNQLVFESVVDLNEEMKPLPQLADSWMQEDRTWTFYLRSGILFHTGDELVAADVVASYDMFKQVTSDNPYAARMSLISSMEAVDAFTLRVTARYSGMITLYAMTFPVMQRSTLTDELPRGTGPYWTIEYQQDTALRLERNPLWWKLQPSVESVVALRFEDTASALEALQTGIIDTLGTRSASASIYRKLSGLTNIDYTTTTYEALIPNLSENSVMSDVRVRRACMYAIDRATLVENAYLGMARQSEVPVLPGSWIYESQSALYNYSPERALQLLLQAGWENLTDEVMLSRLTEQNMLKDLKVSIYTYNENRSSVRSNAADIIAQNLRTVGIQATVTVTTRSQTLNAIREGNCDLALVSFNLSETPNLTSLFTEGGNLNLSGYTTEALTELVNKTGSAASEEAFVLAFSNLQKFVASELPIMGLLFRTGTLLSTRSLAGLVGIRESNMLRGIEFVP